MATFGPKTGSTTTAKIEKNIGSSSTFEELDSSTSLHPVTSSSLNPSSEAEALSNVASGIAASLGLAAESAVVTSQEFSEINNPHETSTALGPLSDLEHYGGQEGETLLISYGRVQPSTREGENISTEEVLAQDEMSPLLVESEKRKDLSNWTKSEQHSKGKEVVSQLAIDWDDEGDDESND